MASVTLTNLVKEYPGEKGEAPFLAVRSINLEIRDGEFMVLVGPSGCGKSTTLRAIAGLESVSGGRIFIGDRCVNAVPPKDRNISMVFQSYALYPHKTVFGNLAFGLEMMGIPRNEIKLRVDEVAARLGLEALLNRKPSALSGGQRQRVALGRAIVRQPEVFLFDEPLSNLDAKMRVSTRLEITSLHKSLATTMIYVTHDQVEAMTMGDRICVMNGGAIMQVDEPLKLYHQPANIFVAGFIGSPSMNFIKGKIEASSDGLQFVENNDTTGRLMFEIPKKMAERIEDYTGKSIILGVRPEYIMNPEAVLPGTETVKIQCLLRLSEPMGAETYLHLATGSHEITARVNSRFRYTLHDKVLLSVSTDAMIFFDPDTEQSLTSGHSM